MKAILPVAGMGKRLLPHTQTRPKCLVQVAGKPILGHIIERLKPLQLEELILVVDTYRENEARIKKFVEASKETLEGIPVSYAYQETLNGPADAIFQARQHIDSDVFIIYSDTLFEADLTSVSKIKSDGIIWVRKVENPQRFGLVVTNGDYITKLVEKPEVPPSDLAMIGMFYIKDGPALMKRIEAVIKEGQTVQGEFFLPDPLQLMINEGFRFNARTVEAWYDCGTIDDLLSTNRALLSLGRQEKPDDEQYVIIPPVWIDKRAKIIQSIIGPHVSISAEANVHNAIVSDSIIAEKAVVKNVILQASLIGENTTVRGSRQRLNVGDFSAIDQRSPDGDASL